MNSIATKALVGAGAVALFAASYVGIAVISGAPLHEVPVLSSFVEAPEGAGEEVAGGERAPRRASEPRRTGSELLEANAGLLGAFMIESPYSATELRKLEEELKRKLREMTTERESLEVRALELDEWESSLRERQASLADLRTKLEALEESIELRTAELAAAEVEKDAVDRQGWKDLAKLYKSGEAEVNARMLAEESPEDAARILRELPDQQAGEILRLITPASTRKAYTDAYRAAADPGTED
jgi:flagellar motility protein MotE (MotC chaperone)